MKRSDVFVQILSEITGRSRQELDAVWDAYRLEHPAWKNDDELSQEEAEGLLAAFREEKNEIFAWLVQGANRFILRNTPPNGNA